MSFIKGMYEGLIEAIKSKKGSERVMIMAPALLSGVVGIVANSMFINARKCLVDAGDDKMQTDDHLFNVSIANVLAIAISAVMFARADFMNIPKVSYVLGGLFALMLSANYIGGLDFMRTKRCSSEAERDALPADRMSLASKGMFGLALACACLLTLFALGLGFIFFKTPVSA